MTATVALDSDDKLHRRIAELERDVAYLNNHDQLTGLATRAEFLRCVDKALADNAETNGQCAMIEIGIKGLPRITGALGRHVSDYVISSLSARLTRQGDPEWVLSRLDFYSFAVFAPRISEALEALTLAKRIITLLAEPIDWVDRSLVVEAGAGVALARGLDVDSSTLLHRAGLALKSASDAGGPGYAFFNPALEQAAKRKQDVLGAVQDALSHHYLSLHFQPYFRATGGALAGFEALLRLKHPTLGNVSPVEFIPVAEEAGLIQRIGAWCLAEACRVASSWPQDLSVAVNISPEQFLGGQLLTDVHNAMSLHSFPAYRLEIEITESTFLADTDLVHSQVSALRELGCTISLDDFGTGYSSLSYLWKFPFSKLKIDRSFVTAMDSRPHVKGLLRSIVDLSHNLGLKVTAEGIETEVQARMLRAMKCDLIQGYMTGRPVPETEVAAIIMKQFAESLKNLSSTAEDEKTESLRFAF